MIKGKEEREGWRQLKRKGGVEGGRKEGSEERSSEGGYE